MGGDQAAPWAVGLILAVASSAVAVVLAVRQWKERREREPELSPQDDRHFKRQDVRRFLGSGVLLSIALGMMLGTWIDPRLSRMAAKRFAWTWIGVGVLILLLLTLAMFDWIRNRSYARRHRRALAAERRAAIQDEIRRRSGPPDVEGGRRGPFVGFSDN